MSKKKLLIIEDEFDLAIMIKKYLEQESYQVKIISNGNEALPVFDKFHPDMILLDIMLPEKDGLEILQQLRTKSTLPIIVISAKETELDRLLGLKMGADDYLTKPFSLKELIARVQTLFRRIDVYQSTNLISNCFQYHQFIIDLNAREISRNDAFINLTTKEFVLLAFLLKHPKQVLSKEQLYDTIWGVNEYGNINTVAIHIQKIREKLGESHEIKTIRGIGYRFDGVLR